MTLKTHTILHIEDDDIDSMVMERAFKSLDMPHQIIRARDGIDALNILRGNEVKVKLPSPPDIVIMDLNMPRMNGIEFLEQIRCDEALRHLHVYVITTSDDENDKRQAFKYNVAGYILKPVDLESFKQMLSALNNFWNISQFPS
jgi:CheY-like chemotaxis protein